MSCWLHVHLHTHIVTFALLLSYSYYTDIKHVGFLPNTDPDDYNTTTSLLTFGPDMSQFVVGIPITNDIVYEPFVEEFLSNLELVTNDADVMVRPDEARILITDEDSKSSWAHSIIACTCDIFHLQYQLQRLR